MAVIRVDGSGLDLWRKTCQLKYYWSYIKGIEKKGKMNPDSPFIHGTLDHEALAVIYHPDTWLDITAAHKELKKKWLELKLLDDLAETDPDHIISWANVLADADTSLERYLAEYGDSDTAAFEPVGTEIPFRIKLHEQVEFYGKVDAAIRWKKNSRLPNTDYIGDGRIFFPEFKFYANPDEDPPYIEWAPQLSRYNMVGTTVYGHDEFGGMINRINRKKHSDKLPNHLCHVVKRTTDELLFTAKNVVTQALQMKFALEHPLGINFLVPRLDDYPYAWQNECVRCEYNNDLCKAYRRGADFEAVEQAFYQLRHPYAMSDQDVSKIEIKDLAI